MQIVAQQLEFWAKEKDKETERDLFGRSAFNRYYYAAFLVTREMLGALRPTWRHTAHAAIPELLEAGLKKRLIGQIRRSRAKNLITVHEGSIL